MSNASNGRHVRLPTSGSGYLVSLMLINYCLPAKVSTLLGPAATTNNPIV